MRNNGKVKGVMEKREEKEMKRKKREMKNEKRREGK